MAETFLPQKPLIVKEYIDLESCDKKEQDEVKLVIE